jgi:hypothetical protein
VHEAGAGHGLPVVCTVNDEVCGDANDTVVQDVGADSDTGTPATLSESAGNADKNPVKPAKDNVRAFMVHSLQSQIKPGLRALVAQPYS